MVRPSNTSQRHPPLSTRLTSWLWWPRPALALALASPLVACGASSAAVTPPAGSPDEVVDAAEPPPVEPGRYHLSMSARCDAREETATGTLLLEPISAAADAADGPGEGSLLWGQTNLDFGELARCLGQPATTSGEPIHPSVLVEVLRWDGARHHQVLLVSTESPRPDGSAGVGVALWVERVEGRRIAGVWSRWELMERGEGRWRAERMPGP